MATEALTRQLRKCGNRAMGYRIAGESQHTLKGIEP